MTGSRQPGTPARWALPIALAAVAVALQVTGGPEGWRLERAVVLAEPWRLVTGHLVHLGWGHLLMNLAGLAVVWALLGPAMTPGRWAATVLACGAGVSLGLLLLSPQVPWYAGFSGILHGLIAAGALAGFRRLPGICGVLLGLLAVKLTVEQFLGPGEGTARLIGGNVIVDAHLYGALAGLACGGLLILLDRSRPA
jgi:rhomboid family GlyGly-CTERM serine protease